MAFNTFLQLFLIHGVLPPYSKKVQVKSIVYSSAVALFASINSMAYEWPNYLTHNSSVIEMGLIVFLFFMRVCTTMSHVYETYRNWDTLTNIVWPALKHIRLCFSIVAFASAGLGGSFYAFEPIIFRHKVSSLWFWRITALAPQRFICYLIVIEFCACLDYFSCQMDQTLNDLNENCNIEQILIKQHEHVAKIRRVNQMFGSQLFASYLALFVAVLFDLFVVIMSPRITTTLALVYGFKSFIELYLMALLVFPCSTLIKKNERFTRKLEKLAIKWDQFAKNVRLWFTFPSVNFTYHPLFKQSKVFLYLAFKDPLEITANQYFQIQRGLIVKVAAAIYSFTTILVQFSSSFKLEKKEQPKIN